ncbi:hypothetical protein B296_00030949, partial [Ensete ventricosum]
ITALCPISLLERTSDLLRWKQKDPTFELPWITHSFPILCDSSPLYLTPSVPDPLTETEELDLRVAQQRLSKICHRCAEAGIPLVIDAEYATLQPAVDYFTYSAAIQFNHGDQPMVYGTIQAYLRDSRERMANAVEAAEREGIPLGIKLVRGAYLTRETNLASSLGVPSPIHGSIQETHQCFDNCAAFLLERVRRGSGAILLATHNVRSDELGIGKEDQKLQFAQLLGMADGLSLGLKNAGFQVSKYVPFGPVEQVIPYLLRRAEENRGLLSTSAADRQLIRFVDSITLLDVSNFKLVTLLCCMYYRKELIRRLATAVIGRT